MLDLHKRKWNRQIWQHRQVLVLMDDLPDSRGQLVG